MTKNVMISTIQDAQRLNYVASNEGMELYVSCGDVMLDARSLLGLLTLVGKEVHLVVEDDCNPRYFKSVVKKMKLAEV